MSYLETSDQTDDHEAYQQAVRRMRFYCEGDGKEIVDWWKKQAASIKRYDPDFSLVRLRPKMPYERNPTTWDDIMDEIGTEKILEEEKSIGIAEVLDRHENRIKELETEVRSLLGLQYRLLGIVEQIAATQDRLVNAWGSDRR